MVEKWRLLLLLLYLHRISLGSILVVGEPRKTFPSLHLATKRLQLRRRSTAAAREYDDEERGKPRQAEASKPPPPKPGHRCPFEGVINDDRTSCKRLRKDLQKILTVDLLGRQDE